MKEYMSNFNEEKLKEAFKIRDAYIKGEISLDFANAQMKAHIGRLTPAELAYMEQHFQEKVEDECISEKIDEMLAIYDGVIIEEQKFSDLLNGHPIKNYVDENTAIRDVIKELDSLLTKKYIKNQWDEAFEKLNQFKVHLSRKQNQLYTVLEKKGFDRPTETMWLYDNEIRDKITSITEMSKDDNSRQDIKEHFDSFKESILDLMEKEETILYPTSLELISDDEFREMISGDKEIGYCLISPKNDYENSFNHSHKEEQRLDKEEINSFKDELSQLLSKYGVQGGWTKDTPMNVKQGILSLNQINLMFQHLPVDISYVDENELVAFYSDTKHRVFPRSKGVIGRDVKNCHPKNSVKTVEEIIEKFRSGEQDKVEFWINKPEVFIYILYLAVRDENGHFKGVMEMMQDCTHIRSLQGSQTLLDWDTENKKENANDSDTIASDNQVENTEKITLLKPDMKIAPILDAYPTLKDYMIAKSDKFKMMNSPMFKFVRKTATVDDVSKRTGFSLDVLQREFTKFLEELRDNQKNV
ncbi:DUF438 domain-containing protein [Eggerthia catenaformis]|uniref:DUF438 domain-containing protein n=1 Tax=Eggerthia catenaformis TaxID=31973 RepID=UPI003C6EC1B2